MGGAEEEDRLRSLLPTSFGKAEENLDQALEARYDQAMRPEYRKKQVEENKKLAAQLGNSDNSDSDDNDDDGGDEFPTSHELSLNDHTRAVSAISLDTAGSRAVSASYDTYLNYWDFNGMDATLRAPFRKVEPLETHQLRAASFSKTDENAILVIPRFTKPKVYSREGAEIAEYASGDMYLVDMNNTKGHVAEMTHGCWSPVDRNMFATSAIDSTVRIWDVNNQRTQKSVITLRTKGGRGSKTRVSTLGFSASGAEICAGTIDGNIALWSTKGPFIRPVQFIEHAHESGSSVVSLISSDDFTFASRATDNTIKLWDRRQFKSPVMTRTNLACEFEDSNITFDPTGRYILAGSTHGELHILDKSDLTSLQVLDLSKTSSSSTTPKVVPTITTVTWHPKLNQIFAGMSTGEIRVLFSPSLSTRGAKIVVEKAPKRRHIDDNFAATTSISAIGLEEGISKYEQEEEAKKRRRQQQRGQGAKFQDEGTQGALPDTSAGAASSRLWGALDQEHVRNNVPLSSLIKEDPREALLKYADRAKKESELTRGGQREIVNEEEEEEDTLDDGENNNRKKQKRM